ncbi:hypothetical protein EKO04_007028 [Ascochyta lentis]|uniref:BTB domain-containing protein n=1 Tax=Ascochyta lentis TaxID=205686 RepID=A0A8H7J1X9_9PLEO|nr:hypothetical protein EKO04_007028 [Ascochyta lentis]
MSKRERQQAPAISQKRTNSYPSLQRSIESLRSSSEELRVPEIGMVRIESPSLASSESSSPLNSDMPIAGINFKAAPSHRTALPRGSPGERYASRAMPSDRQQHLTQSVLSSHKNVITNGLASPQSLRDHSLDVELPASSSSFQTRLPDTFPEFLTGDVYIRCTIVRPHKQWRLHSAVLARHSSWFARFIRERQAISETEDWFSFTLEKVVDRIVLVSHTYVSEGDQPISRALQSTDLPGDFEVKNEVGKIGNPEKTLLENFSTNIESPEFTTKVEQDDVAAIVVVYNQILGAFYNIAPRIIATDIKTATSQAEELIKVAQYLGCAHLVSSHIGNALLQYRQSLYEAILDDPARYLLVALSLENEFIYTESLIHLIGAHPCWPWPTKRSALADKMHQLIAKRSRELDLQVLEAERELLLLTITTMRGVPYSAESYSQFDTWFVVQLFRDTLTNAFRQHDASSPSLKRGSLFRKIRVGGSTYMAYEDVRRMVQAVMPSAVETLGEDLRILKEFASGIVEHLARNQLSLDVEEHKVGWLTCVKVEKEDVPWRAGAIDLEI